MKIKKLPLHIGQATVEYALLVAIAVAALMAMAVYFKRGVQGRLRTSYDEIGQHYNPRTTTTIGLSTTDTVFDSRSVSGGGLTVTRVLNRQEKIAGESVSRE